MNWIRLFALIQLIVRGFDKLNLEPGGVRPNEVDGGERIISSNNPLFDVYFDLNMSGEKLNSNKFPLDDANEVLKWFVGGHCIRESKPSNGMELYCIETLKDMERRAVEVEDYDLANRCKIEMERRADQFVKDIVSKIN